MLHYACAAEDRHMIAALVLSGAKVEVANTAGEMPLNILQAQESALVEAMADYIEEAKEPGRKNLAQIPGGMVGLLFMRETGAMPRGGKTFEQLVAPEEVRDMMLIAGPHKLHSEYEIRLYEKAEKEVQKRKQEKGAERSR